MRASFGLALVLSSLVLASGQNLLQNSGCDLQGASDASTPSFWTVSSGAWRCNFRPTATPAYSPSNFFYAGEVAYAELYQDVIVSDLADQIDTGVNQFVVAAYVRSLGTGGDNCRVQIEMYDGNNNQLQVTGNDPYAPSDRWDRYVTAAAAVQGTRRVRVRLISTRIDTSDLSNDGYWDDVSLTFVQQIADTTVAASTCYTCPTNCRRIPGHQFYGTPDVCGRVASGDSCCKSIAGEGFSCPRNSQCCDEQCCAPNTFCHACDSGVFKCLRTDEPSRLTLPIG